MGAGEFEIGSVVAASLRNVLPPARPAPAGRRRQSKMTPALLVVALVTSACSGSDDTSSADTTAVNEVESNTDERSLDDIATADSTPPSTDGSTGPELAGPLGFDTERFEVPAPEVVDPEQPPDHIEPLVFDRGGIEVAPMLDGTGGFRDIDELIDTGVDAGVWTEIEAVRAVVSVVMGELPPQAIAGIDEVSHPSIREVLDRAELLLADDEVDPDQQADLARLTSFFFEPDGPEVQGFRGATIVDASMSQPQQQSDCGVGELHGQLGEDTLFRAVQTDRPYCKAESGSDTLFYPLAEIGESDVWELAAQRYFEIADLAREGYRQLAGTEMPPTKFLISPRSDPGGAYGHVVSRTGATECRGAVFATGDYLTLDGEFDNTLAHEFFHCVQGEWPGSFDGILGEDLVEEAGASYFAYELLGECAASDASRGARLDRETANGSLLRTSYEGWFFWAYLADDGKMSPREIADMHGRIKNGIDIEEAMRTLLPDIDRTMNEFYVRLLGPGLACGYRGWQTTGEQDVTEVGQVKLPDAPWQGTRYKLTYPPKRYFAQKESDGQPIGMADVQEAATANSWVVVEPEIRTECEDDKDWYVVVALGGKEDGVTPDRVFDVTERQDPQCDPCPVGAWDFDKDDLEEFYESFATEGPDIEVDIGGIWTLQFAAPQESESVVSDTQNVTITFTTADGSAPVQLRGGGQGRWQGNETVLDVTNFANSTEASFFGASGSGGSTESVQAVYECEGNEMTITLRGVDVGLTRIDPAEGTRYFD